MVKGGNMLFKFISQTCIEPYYGQPLIVNGVRYSNVRDETILKSVGYKPKMIDSEPEYDEQTQMLVANYIEENNIIKQSWIVMQKPPIEPPPVQPPALEERVDACEYMLIDMLNFM